jgi:hypothetical protein
MALEFFSFKKILGAKEVSRMTKGERGVNWYYVRHGMEGTIREDDGKARTLVGEL